MSGLSDVQILSKRMLASKATGLPGANSGLLLCLTHDNTNDLAHAWHDGRRKHLPCKGYFVSMLTPSVFSKWTCTLDDAQHPEAAQG
jgi:hypothetical protein